MYKITDYFKILYNNALFFQISSALFILLKILIIHSEIIKRYKIITKIELLFITLFIYFDVRVLFFQPMLLNYFSLLEEYYLSSVFLF